MCIPCFHHLTTSCYSCRYEAHFARPIRRINPGWIDVNLVAEKCHYANAINARPPPRRVSMGFLSSSYSSDHGEGVLHGQLSRLHVAVLIGFQELSVPSKTPDFVPCQDREVIEKHLSSFSFICRLLSGTLGWLGEKPKSGRHDLHAMLHGHFRCHTPLD